MGRQSSVRIQSTEDGRIPARIWASRDGLDNGAAQAWVKHAKVEAASHEPRIGNRMMHCCVGDSDCHTTRGSGLTSRLLSTYQLRA